MKSAELPWKQLYDMAVRCCGHTDVRSFTIECLREMQNLVSFDEAIVFYIDGNRRMNDYYLYNINPKWMNLYLSYYSHADRGAYSITQRDLDNLDDVYVHKWAFEYSREFIPDYIRPRNLVSSLGFPLRDQSNCVRTVIVFDRLSDVSFSPRDVEIVREARRLLSLHHRMLFGPVAENPSAYPEFQLLTNREREILNLLRQGLSPASISHILHIAVPTTNRHIHNIYKKLKVCSRAELMVKLQSAI